MSTPNHDLHSVDNKAVDGKIFGSTTPVPASSSAGIAPVETLAIADKASPDVNLSDLNAALQAMRAPQSTKEMRLEQWSIDGICGVY